MVLALQILNAVAFVVVTLIAARRYAQRRDAAHLWFMAAVGALSLVLLGGLTMRILGDNEMARRLVLATLVAVPYCLSCFAASFGEWSPWVKWGSAVSAVLLCLWTLSGVSGLDEGRGLNAASGIYLLALLGHWVIVSGLVVRRLWQVAADQPNIARKRMRTMSGGVLALAAAMVVAGSAPASDTARTIIYLFGILAVGSFAAGFSPPHALLTYWREPERARLFTSLNQAMAIADLRQAVSTVLEPVTMMLAGTGARLQTPHESFLYAQAPEPYPEQVSEPSVVRHGQTTLAVFPMEAGQLVVATSPQAPFLSGEDLRLGQALAAILDLIFDRERRQAEIIQLAQAEERNLLLQQAVLPEALPQIEGMELAARYLPARMAEQVGGDWYDAFSLDERRVALVIGDVAGKGLPAAALMGRIRNALWALLRGADTPREALAHLEELMEQVATHKMTTLACVVIDTHTQEMSYVSAGHLPPMLVAADGTASLLTTTNPPLGAGIPATRSETLQLAPGDRLLLYTDGLVERRRGNIAHQIEKLRQLVQTAPEGAEALVEHVLQGMLEEQSGEDDCAVLAFQLVGVPQKFKPLLPALV